MIRYDAATMTLLSMALLLFQAAGTPLRVPDLQPPFRESAPNSPAENVILRAGNALYAERKYDEATARYEEALKMNPDSGYILNQLADSYFQIKEYQKAVETAVKGTEYVLRQPAQLHTRRSRVADRKRCAGESVPRLVEGLLVAETLRFAA